MTHRSPSEPTTLLELIAAVRPDSTDPFLLAVDGSVMSTYGDASRRSAQIAHALLASGVRPGDRVALQAEKSVASLMVYLACVRSGAVLLPMNTGYTADEVAYLVDDAEPAIVLDDARLANSAQLQTSCPRCSTITSARPTIWPRSCTPAARRASRRVRCCRIAT